MKRVIVALACIAAAGSLWAVGDKESPGAKTIELKMGIVANTSSLEYKAATRFAELVAERSKNAVTITLYPGSQLGDDRAMLEQVSAGVLDLTFGETGRFGLWVPYAEIFQLPFVFDGFEHLVRATETDFGRQLKADLLAKGWRILGNGYNGTRQTSSNRPINSIADMRGLKLRVPNAKANMAYAQLTGASAVPMAFGEVYMALKTNTVDGQENPLPAINAMKFYEVQSYIALTGHILNDQNYVVSEKTWARLPKEVQDLIAKSAAEAAAYHTELFKADEARLISFFADQGVKITNPDRAPFRAAVAPIVDEYNAKFGDKAIRAINSVR
ncbi:MAG: sialic acid TRAP transporter substrate-binding protein SiaP [Spirochaetes bacterium]|nr:sialic acid TRAP transporter substrate-binding protein SiaP [Spirochaetota bacterium]MBU1080209.1 sialic acid TRAP transporter substrate-binding protein SiaP [Spirochaetota bacterium]